MSGELFAAGMFGWHFVLGAVLGYGALSFYETSVEHGAVFSLVFTVTVVVVERWYGSRFLEVSWNVLETGIVASILGGILGLAAILLLFEPDTRDTGAVPDTASKNSEKAD